MRLKAEEKGKSYILINSIFKIPVQKIETTYRRKVDVLGEALKERTNKFLCRYPVYEIKLKRCLLLKQTDFYFTTLDQFSLRVVSSQKESFYVDCVWKEIRWNYGSDRVIEEAVLLAMGASLMDADETA